MNLPNPRYVTLKFLSPEEAIQFTAHVQDEGEIFLGPPGVDQDDAPTPSLTASVVKPEPYPDPRLAFLTPDQHLRRARELIRLAEQKLVEDPAGYHIVGPTQLAMTHIEAGREADRQRHRIQRFKKQQVKEDPAPTEES